MSRKLEQAAAVAVAAMLVFTVSGAFAQDPLKGAETTRDPATASAQAPNSADSGDNSVRFVSREVVQPLPGSSAATDAPNGDRDDADVSDADSLSELVASISPDEKLSRDMRCLAGAIYFEARGEPLEGQLAVGQVVVNRAESGRFPTSYCGVVLQPSQFSFVRGGGMPTINTSSRAWRNASAIAKIAHQGLWDSEAKDALFFHASTVKPAWHLNQVARVSRHVFYR